MASYYVNEFGQQYTRLNDGRGGRAQDKLNELKVSTKKLQYNYISNNPNPLGEKDALASADDGTQYSQWHKKYHPSIQKFLKEFNYYDIFLVDNETGHIVYSVFKELDFATSLKDGPYANTNFARSFVAADHWISHKRLRLITRIHH